MDTTEQKPEKNKGGRPKGRKNDKTLEQNRKRVLFNRLVDRKWKVLIDRQITEALEKGAYRQRHFIIEQRIGRPQEKMELSGGVRLVIDE